MLIKSGEGVEEGARVTDVVFDKTGTLTRGRASVIAMYILRDASADKPITPINTTTMMSKNEVSLESKAESDGAEVLSWLNIIRPPNVPVKEYSASGLSGSDQAPVDYIKAHAGRSFQGSQKLSFNLHKTRHNPSCYSNGSLLSALPVGDEVMDLLWLTACAERDSEHTIGRAIVEFVDNVVSESIPVVAEVITEAFTGLGVKCSIRLSDKNEVRTVAIGSLNYLLDEEKVKCEPKSVLDDVKRVAAQLQCKGCIVVFVAVDGLLKAFFELSDELRLEAYTAVSTLQRHGIVVWMVTGDNIQTARAIGDRVGLFGGSIIAGALPQRKLQFIRELQERGKHVAFVGDGK